MFSKTKILLIGLLFATAVQAQPLSLSLEQARQMAVDSSYATRNARYDTEKKRKEVKEVLAAGLPQVNGSAQFQNFLDIPVSLVPAEFTGGEPGDFTALQFGTKYNLTAGLSASQLIFDGTYLVGLKASKTVVQLSINQELRTEMEIKLNVGESYYTVLLAEENIKVLQENLDNLDKTLRDTRALYENGLTEEQDVDQLQLNKNQVQINYDRSLQFLDVSRQTLNFLLGLELERDVVLSDKIEDLVKLNNNMAYLETAPNLTAHPDYLLAKSNLEIQELTVRGEKSYYYPSLSAFFNHQQVGQRNEFNFLDGDEPWYPTTIVGATVNVPIFSGFRRNARLAQAKIGFEQGVLQLEQTEENLRLGITRSRSNYANALKTWENQKQSYELARRISEKTNIKYTAGVSTSFELNVAESQLLNEQGKYIESAYNLLTAKQELDAALNVY